MSLAMTGAGVAVTVAAVAAAEAAVVVTLVRVATALVPTTVGAGGSNRSMAKGAKLCGRLVLDLGGAANGGGILSLSSGLGVEGGVTKREAVAVCILLLLSLPESLGNERLSLGLCSDIDLGKAPAPVA